MYAYLATYIHVTCHTNLLYNERRNFCRHALHGEQYKAMYLVPTHHSIYLHAYLTYLLITGAQIHSSS